MAEKPKLPTKPDEKPDPIVGMEHPAAQDAYEYVYGLSTHDPRYFHFPADKAIALDDAHVADPKNPEKEKINNACWSLLEAENDLLRYAIPECALPNHCVALKPHRLSALRRFNEEIRGLNDSAQIICSGPLTQNAPAPAPSPTPRVEPSPGAAAAKS